MNIAVQVAVIVTFTAFAVIVTWLFFRLLKGGVKFVAGAVGEEKATPALLVAIAAIAFLFPTLISAFWRMLVAILTLALVRLPNTIEGLGKTVPSCDGETLEYCVKMAVQAFSKASSDYAVAMLQEAKLNEFPIADLLMAAGLLALVLVVAKKHGADLFSHTSDSARRLWNSLLATPRRTRTQVASALLIAIAAYLSLSAIAAVSLMKHTEPNKELTHAKLDRLLASAEITGGQEVYPEKETPLSRIDEVAQQAFHDNMNSAELDAAGAMTQTALISSSDVPNLVRDWAQRVKTQMQPFYVKYDNLTTAYENMRSSVFVEQHRLKQSALMQYDINNLGRLGGREQANHFLRMNKWYGDTLRGLFKSLDDCRAILVEYRNLTNSYVANVLTRTSMYGSGKPSNASSLQSLSDASLQYLDGLSNYGSQKCQAVAWSGLLPEREDFGQNLGVLGHATGWILRTESIPLSLIVGLIGFGLLGALISSFIRAKDLGPSEPKLFGVICIGASAAIVTFLAAYGGIAIMSQSDQDPNPYVLFVTCLVAAVFGEDVWQWARQRFVPGSQGQDQGESEPKKKAGGPAI